MAGELKQGDKRKTILRNYYGFKMGNGKVGPNPTQDQLAHNKTGCDRTRLKHRTKHSTENATEDRTLDGT